MEQYTIYCTPEQTKKALELGAPIDEAMSRYNAINAIQRVERGKATFEEYANQGIALVSDKYVRKSLKIPTAEQMIGWLEEQGIKINIVHSNVDDSMRFKIHKSEDFDCEIAWNFHYPSRKEATLAAIDAALDYLIKKRMERKIGEIVTLPDGRKVEVVEYGNDSCCGCVGVNAASDLCLALGICYHKDRTDHKNIIYKEVK